MAENTGRHRLSIGVLALAAVALVVDRAFLLPPDAGAESSAALYAVPRDDDAADPDLTADVPDIPQRVTIADRLDRLAGENRFDLAHVPDAFGPSPEWIRAQQSQPVIDVSALDRFKRAHKLTGVMASADGGYAIINGRMLFIGQDLDGFTLVSIQPRSAILESGGAVVELALEE